VQHTGLFKALNSGYFPASNACDIFALIYLYRRYSTRWLTSTNHLIYSQHRVRGEVKFHAKEFPAALEDLNTALELEPEDIAALRYLPNQYPALHLDHAVLRFLIGIIDSV
jgi:hypothetical protein